MLGCFETSSARPDDVDRNKTNARRENVAFKILIQLAGRARHRLNDGDATVFSREDCERERKEYASNYRLKQAVTFAQVRNATSIDSVAAPV